MSSYENKWYSQFLTDYHCIHWLIIWEDHLQANAHQRSRTLAYIHVSAVCLHNYSLQDVQNILLYRSVWILYTYLYTCMESVDTQVKNGHYCSDLMILITVRTLRMENSWHFTSPVTLLFHFHPGCHSVTMEGLTTQRKWSSNKQGEGQLGIQTSSVWGRGRR